MGDGARRVVDLLGVDPADAGSWVRGAALVFDDVSATTVKAHADLGAEHRTPWGVVHGGLFATVAESAASVGASAAVLERGQFAVGVDNLTDFLRPMTEGRIDVVAVAVQQGKSDQLWQVTIDRSDGKTVSRSRVRLRNIALPERR